MLSREVVAIATLTALCFISLPVRGEQAATADSTARTAKKIGSLPAAREVATPTTFSPAMVEFLHQPLPSQITTINPNGSPQVTVMWFAYENGAVLFTTTTDRVKFRNQRKDPRAVFSVVDPANMYKWVIVHGTLSVDNRDPAAFYRGLAEHYLEGEGLAQWRKTAQMEKRTVLKLTPTQIRTMGFPQK